LHGLTVPKENFDVDDFRKKTREIAAIYVASGLNMKNSHIFIQSEIRAISELSYLLSVNTTIGELQRMTQYKEKSSKTKLKNGTEFIPTGILLYPTLMAADILAFNSNIVPVGVDQKQHIELTRNIANRINNKYGDVLTMPEPLIEEDLKIMALQNPEKKMSKSDENKKNTIFILDNEDVIRKKIKSSITDSENKVIFNRKTKPGISNLMSIYSSMANCNYKEIEKKYESLGYKEFKEDLIAIILKDIIPIQKKYYDILDSKELDDILSSGKEKAESIAEVTLINIKRKFGLK
jgi:tryptophanyl-tRNA synthetase